MSGMRPTGRLHIGHYFGALLNWVEFQSEYDSYFSIVDWHALTTKFQQTKDIQPAITEIALDCGYPASSLKERVYALSGADGAPERCGILIYTATAGAQGTLSNAQSSGYPSAYARPITP